VQLDNLLDLPDQGVLGEHKGRAAETKEREFEDGPCMGSTQTEVGEHAILHKQTERLSWLCTRRVLSSQPRTHTAVSLKPVH
jgi:hypothetical protein